MPRDTSPSRDWRPCAWGAALAILVLIVYWPTLGNGFIWDDETYVQNNVSLRSIYGLFNIWFKLRTVPQYYPLVHSTFWVEYHLWELQPRGYHAVNLLIHATAVVLFWRLLVRLSVPGAWLAAAIFAAHPVGVESVAWVTERKNVLSCALALGSLLALLRSFPLEVADSQLSKKSCLDRSWYVLALGLCLAALLSKTVTASVPAVLLVIYWWKRGRVTWLDLRRLAPFFAMGLALAAVTVSMEKTHVAKGSEWDLTIIERVLVAGRALWFYAVKLVWPHPLVFFYPRWTIDARLWWQYLFPAGALMVMLVLWLGRARIGRGPLAAVWIFAGVLVPALGFFDVYPFRFSFVADHFQYHACMALIALGAAAFVLAFARLLPRTSWVATVAAAALVMPLVVVAHQKTYVYRDLGTLYEDTIALNPESWTAHHNLATILAKQGKYDAAIEHFRDASKSGSLYGRSRVGLAGALAALGRFDEATNELQAVLDGPFDDADKSSAQVVRAAIFTDQGQIDAALASFRSAMALGTLDADASYNYGVLLGKTGDIEGAIRRLRESLAIDPNSADAQHSLGVTLASAGKAAEAISPFRMAVHLQPGNAGFHKDLGVALVLAGDPANAEQQFRQAIALDPQNAKAHTWLGVVLRDRGNLNGAISEFQTALKHDPRSAEAASHLQKALDATGRQRQ